MNLRKYLILLLGFLLLQQLGAHTVFGQTNVPVAVTDTDFTANDYILLVGNVSENDTLPEGVIFQFLNSARYGTIQWEDNSTGAFSYWVDPISIRLHGFGTPDSSRYDYIAYSVCLGSLCDTTMIEIFLRHQNDAPIPVPDEFYVEFGNSRLCNFGANDLEPDSISDPFSSEITFEPYINPTNGTLSNFGDNGIVTYTPNPTFIGDDLFRYQAQDHCGLYSYGIVSIHVVGNNLNPSANDVFTLSANEDSSLTTSLSSFASDPENDPLIFETVGNPMHGIASISDNGVLIYTPAADFIGYDTLNYEVTDLVGQTDTAYVAIHVVNANNDAPDATNQYFSGSEDEPLTQYVAYTDLIDGDALTYSLQSQGSHGIASISADGILSYVPNANYNGNDTIYYRSCDNGNLCDVASIFIQLTPTNDEPQAQNDYNTVPRNTILNGSVASNDSDIDSPMNSLVYGLQNGPMHGAVTVQSNGAYTYQPETTFYGEDSFSYTVCDMSGACANASVHVNVTYANLAPSAGNVNVILNEDETVTLDLQSVSADIDGGDLTYNIIGIETQGTFESIVNVGGYYTPALNSNGTWTLEFKVCDTGNLCDTALINLTVLPVNDAPQVSSETFTTEEDSDVIWLPQFSDIDSETLQINTLTSPSHSNLIGDIWIPENNFAGVDSFLFEVCDEGGLCTQSVAYLNVTAINDAPEAIPLIFNSPEDEWVETTLTASDIDSQEFSFYLIEPEALGQITLTENGALQWLPQTNFNGTLEAEYRVCDNEGACDTASISLNITPVNDLPQSNFPPLLLEEDASMNWSYSSYLSDIDGDMIFLSMADSSGVQTLLNPISNSIDFVAISDYFGDASCVVNICDNQGGCITDTIHIFIQPVNDAPVAQNSTLVTFQDISITDSWYAFTSDADDSELYFEAVPTYGNLTTDESAVFVYTPPIGFSGADSVWFTVCDSAELCDFGLLIITVYPSNQPPIALDGIYETCQGVSISVDINELITDDVLTASDLTYSWSSDVPAALTFNATTALLTISTSSQYAGTMHVEINVCDNGSPSLCDSGVITVVVSASLSAQINAANVQQVSCNGMNDGSIAITGIDTSEEVLFEWDNGSVGSLISNLSPGNYTVTVIPQAECPVPSTTEFTITEPSALEIMLTVNSISNESGGFIVSSVEGGTPPYMYSWTGPNGYLSTNASAEALSSAGTYTLTIMDGNGCSASQTATVTALSEMADLSNCLIYPNPAQGDFITIELRNATILGGLIQVIDATGRVVTSIQNVQQTTRIATDELNAGVYFVVITGSEATIIRQIILTP